MSTPEATLSIQDLSDQAEVSRRAIRYYIQRGLLASPQGRGRGSRYTQEHLETLLWLKRAQLDGYTLDQIERGVVSPSTSLPSTSLPSTSLPSTSLPSISPALSASALFESAPSQDITSKHTSKTAARAPKRLAAPRESHAPSTANGSRWTRYQITADVELSIRDHALSPQDQEALARHLLAALTHITGDTP